MDEIPDELNSESLEEKLLKYTPKNRVKQKLHKKINEKAKNYHYIKEIYDNSKALSDNSSFVDKISSLEKDVAEKVHKLLGINEKDYILVSQGSCNTNEFDINSSDVDIEIIVTNEELAKRLTDETRPDSLKNKLKEIQDEYMIEGENDSRVKLWPTTLDNILSDEFRGSKSLRC